MLIALDPGKHYVYGALFDRGELSRLVKLDVAALKTGQITRIDSVYQAVIEKPNINKNTPNWQSVLDVACSGYLVAGMLRVSLIEYEPNTWKGSVKKPIHHDRVLAALHGSELRVIPNVDAVQATIRQAKENIARTGKVTGYSRDWHNHLDAVGLGLFALGRVGRAGIKK